MHPDERDRTMWRELRSWPRSVQFGAAGLGVLIVGSSFAIGPLFFSSHLPDGSEWPAGQLAEDGAEYTAEPGGAEEDGAAVPGVADYAGEPLWTAAIAEDGEEAVPVEQGVLHRTDDAIELRRDGDAVWTWETEEYWPEAGVAGGLLVVATPLYDVFEDEEYVWPGRERTVALDLDTGEEVWSDEDASFVSVYSDAVLMTECTGEQDDHVGDCTMYARDPADLSVLWSVDTYASAQDGSGSDWTGEPLPDRLIVDSYPTGHESRVRTVYEDGEALVSTDADGTAVIEGDTLLLVDDYDENPADGCTAAVAGLLLDGSGDEWELTARTRKSGDLSSCGGLASTQAVDGLLPLTIDGLPSAVDVATGETAWEAPAEGQAIAAGAGVLAVADWEAAEDNLVVYDIVSGEERWRGTALIDAGTRASAVGSTLWLYGDASMWGRTSYDAIAYDLATGEGAVLPGSTAYFLAGAVVTVREERLSAWPVELW